MTYFLNGFLSLGNLQENQKDEALLTELEKVSKGEGLRQHKVDKSLTATEVLLKHVSEYKETERINTQ